MGKVHTFGAVLLLVGSVAFMAQSVVAGPGGARLTPAEVFSPGGKARITAKDYAMVNKRDVSPSGYPIERLSDSEIASRAKGLTDEERRILLDHGTEPAFCGTLLDNKMEGTYVCRLCELPLFSSDAKFTSGTGWPSFYQPVDQYHLTYIEDKSYGMTRIEIRCARCDGHQGHVFEDGPKPTGLRFCLNSASLKFYEKGAEMPEAAKPIETETAYFAGGCFWGVEDRFQHLDGVIDAASGYQGGHVENPTYKQVCYTDTGHAESVRVIYDPTKISYDDLLAKFFEYHNPTQLNRQGPDYGPQYRSAIFPSTDEQKAKAEAFIAAENKEGRWAGKVVTKVEPMATFYEAEEYHQDYNAKHGRSCAIPQP